MENLIFNKRSELFKIIQNGGPQRHLDEDIVKWFFEFDRKSLKVVSDVTGDWKCLKKSFFNVKNNMVLKNDIFSFYVA